MAPQRSRAANACLKEAGSRARPQRERRATHRRHLVALARRAISSRDLVRVARALLVGFGLLKPRRVVLPLSCGLHLQVKNSWGESWGMDGYVLLERGSSQDGGMCGILADPSYVNF